MHHSIQMAALAEELSAIEPGPAHVGQSHRSDNRPVTSGLPQ